MPASDPPVSDRKLGANESLVERSRRQLRSYLKPLPRRGSTTDAVTQALREAILDGVLRQSTWLREEELSRDLSVSRTPVREALRRLADEGLTFRSANRGTQVTSVTIEDAVAVYAVRESLEGLAAHIVTSRCPPGLVDRLADLHRQMADNTETGNTARLATLNLEFTGSCIKLPATPTSNGSSHRSNRRYAASAAAPTQYPVAQKKHSPNTWPSSKPSRPETRMPPSKPRLGT